MKKHVNKLSLLVMAALLAACAAPTPTHHRTNWFLLDANRADRILTTAADYGSRGNWEIHRADIARVVNEKCAEWGYNDGASALGDVESTCIGKTFGRRCTRTRLSIKYQCIKKP